MLRKSKKQRSALIAPVLLATEKYVAPDSPELWSWPIFPPGFHSERHATSTTIHWLLLSIFANLANDVAASVEGMALFCHGRQSGNPSILTSVPPIIILRVRSGTSQASNRA